MPEAPVDYDRYQQSLPIPREVVVPELTPTQIAAITETVFWSGPAPAADLLFVFGTSSLDDWIWAPVVDAFNAGMFPRVLVTGFIGRAYYKTGRPLARLAQTALIQAGLPAAAILVQDNSTNTWEDVALSLPQLEAGLPTSRLMFFSKAHHSGRCWRTLRRLLPDVQVSALTYDANYDGVVVREADWHEQPAARARV